MIEGEYTFAPDPDWIRILEFYCPGCGRQIETEYLPPGHPITHDIELDIDSLKARLAAGDLVIQGGKLVKPTGGHVKGVPERPSLPMTNSIDIDVGGTFTDLVLTLDGERHIVKAPTTPHDLSVGFLNASRRAARRSAFRRGVAAPRSTSSATAPRSR